MIVFSMESIVLMSNLSYLHKRAEVQDLPLLTGLSHRLNQPCEQED